MSDAIEAAAQAAYTEWLKPSSDTSWANIARAAITAYEAAKGGGVGVKPLEWRNVDASPQSDDWWLEAVTPFGPYTVAFVEEHKLPWLLEPFRSNLDSNYATEANAARMREALKAGGGTAVTEDGVVLTIQISGSTLAHAVKYMPNAEIFDKGLQDFFQPEVVDEAAFLKEMANALQHEEEDGTTLVHRMLDEAAIHIMHVGGDGVLSAQEVRDRARASLSNTSEGGERNGD